MLGRNGGFRRKRGNRLGYVPATCAAAPRTWQPLDGAIEQVGRLLAPDLASQVEPLPSRGHTVPNRIRRLARRSGQLGGPRAWHRDHEVEAVEERPRELVPERGQSLR